MDIHRIPRFIEALYGETKKYFREVNRIERRISQLNGMCAELVELLSLNEDPYMRHELIEVEIQGIALLEEMKEKLIKRRREYKFLSEVLCILFLIAFLSR